MAEIQYADGNVNTPVVVHGDDPTNENNVLVTPLGPSTSVPRESVTELNEHVVNQADLAATLSPEDKDAKIAELEAKLAAAGQSEEENE